MTVNQRYPMLYSEKRPFFMEAGNLFDLAAVGDGLANMVMPVHTRSIVDPQWGIRLTGEQGKGSFALLAAADRSPGNPWEDGEENPDLGRKATFWIGRGKLGLGKDNYIGLLYSGREFGAEYNRALAADFSFRFLKNHQVMGHYIQSFSNRPDGGGEANGGYLTAEYAYSTRATPPSWPWSRTSIPASRWTPPTTSAAASPPSKLYLQTAHRPQRQEAPLALRLHALAVWRRHPRQGDRPGRQGADVRRPR